MVRECGEGRKIDLWIGSTALPGDWWCPSPLAHWLLPAPDETPRRRATSTLDPLGCITGRRVLSRAVRGLGPEATYI